MLFNPTPKDERKDFFDKEKEMEQLKELRTPLILVLGLRRTGKSSLIKISTKELEHEKGTITIYIDLRKFEEKNYFSYREFLLQLQSEINKLKRFSKIIDSLKKIEGVSIAGNEIRLSWNKEDRLQFSSLLDALEEGSDNKVVIVLDEAQELLKMRGLNILPSLAYAYDNLKKVKIIISGSEIGLLYDFLRINDAKSPLYGRAFSTVELKPFSKEEAMEFLRKGFEELKIPFNKEEETYEKLGGIPGWLTYFGFTYLESRNYEESINRTLDYAKLLIKKEFDSFISARYTAKKRYYIIMKVISRCGRWSDVKRALEAEEGIEISDSEVYNYLSQLTKHSWIVKNNEMYCPSEPLIGYTFT
ncbi:AAA family ATPase [Acidianus manzaensis]|uniref:ATPase n=1 Tax=Acidianus manzaensis TaxID=282676 RepID=A0A1W6K2E4_9CREN|nr:ATP-binding protein [Acidianus manzaensis]ARM76679.1 ATPase [Acidianus manzaensis]